MADFMDSNMPTWRTIASIFGNYIDWDIPSDHGPDDDDEKDENIVQQAHEEAALSDEDDSTIISLMKG